MAYTKDELLKLVEALVESDHINTHIKMSIYNWELLGRPDTIAGRKILPVPGLPDERLYTAGGDD